MTALQELIKELEDIKVNKCKTLQEMVFFDGVLAIIEGKYISKEKAQIMDAYDTGNRKGYDEHKLSAMYNLDEEYYQNLTEV